MVGEVNDLRYALPYLIRRFRLPLSQPYVQPLNQYVHGDIPLIFSLALPIPGVETRLQAKSAPSRAALFHREVHRMPNHSVHKASDLASDERMFVERWLGRALSTDETVTLKAYLPHAAPAGAERDALRRSIIAQAREIGSRGHACKVGGVPGSRLSHGK